MQEVRGSIPGRGTTDFCTLILFVNDFNDVKRFIDAKIGVQNRKTAVV